MKRLRFNTRVSFPTGEAGRGLREGIELFRAAEQLGYQSGWAYQCSCLRRSAWRRTSGC